MKRVLLIESGQFIGGVIRSLFTDYDELTIIEESPYTVRQLIDAIKKHRPDIVVMDDTLKNEFLAKILAYMQESDRFRVIVVNTNSNQVELYQKQQVPVNRTADFFAVL